MLPERTDPRGSLSRPPVPSEASVRALLSSVEALRIPAHQVQETALRTVAVITSVSGPSSVPRSSVPAATSPVGTSGGGHCRAATHLAGPASAASAGTVPPTGRCGPGAEEERRCCFGTEGARRDDAGRPGGDRQVPLGEGTSGPFGFRVGSPPTRRDDRPGPGIPRSPPREGGPVQGARKCPRVPLKPLKIRADFFISELRCALLEPKMGQ